MLRIHTYYSLKYGVLSPEEIIKWFLQSSFPKIVVADINNTTATLSLVREMNRINQKIAAGVDFRNKMEECYTMIAINNEGFEFINAHLSHHLLNKKPFEKRAPYSTQCHVIYPWSENQENSSANLNENLLENLKENEWIGFKIADLTKLQLHPQKKQLIQRGVINQAMTFRNQKDYNAHRLLRAIDNNTLLPKLPVEQQAMRTDTFENYDFWQDKLADFPELMQNTENILNQCEIQFEFEENASPQNKKTFTGNKNHDFELLKHLCTQGLAYRYKKVTAEIQERISRELEIIRDKEFVSYFLITWDFVHYARSKNYFYVGRGSGANSIVAYLLQITNVDPLELDLYFERFINLYRKNPPDFDIDFSWKERDDVIKYILTKYPNASLLCTYTTFQYRSAIREIGKVFGLPKTDVDKLASNKFPFAKMDSMEKLVIKYSTYIANFPSHLSIHAGGIVISEKPITWYSAVFMPPKGFPTTQFSMLEAEDVGLYKFDVLSQRGLSKIRDCIDIIAYNQPQEIVHDIHDINYFKQDLKIKETLRNGLALGCFYVESPAMRMLMIKLEVQTYLELVAASSIIRPGVSQSGMMKEYIIRHRIPEKRTEAHPIMLSIMPETYGVMVYQEDVIKVAHYFAGLSLADADVLRRGMSGKYRSRDEFEGVKNTFYKNCEQKGYDAKTIQDVWNQIQSFAGYAFSKGHSASYAVESYQSLYLKTYFPLEYMVATINNFGGYYSTEVYVHEARMLGAKIEAPLLNEISYETKLTGKTMYLGFNLVAGLEKKIIEELVFEFNEKGEFTSFENLMNRVYIPLEQTLLLIRVGALRDFNESKKELFWKTHLYHNLVKKKSGSPLLFEPEQKQYCIPQLEEEKYEQYFEQLELLGFTLCNPFELITINQAKIPIGNLKNSKGLVINTYGYLIGIKPSKTNKGENMYFGTWLSFDGQQIDSVHFPDSAIRYPFNGRGIYEIKGVVTEEFGHFCIEVGYLKKIPYREDYRYSEKVETPNNDVTVNNFRLNSRPNPNQKTKQLSE